MICITNKFINKIRILSLMGSSSNERFTSGYANAVFKVYSIILAEAESLTNNTRTSVIGIGEAHIRYNGGFTNKDLRSFVPKTVDIQFWKPKTDDSTSDDGLIELVSSNEHDKYIQAVVGSLKPYHYVNRGPFQGNYNKAKEVFSLGFYTKIQQSDRLFVCAKDIRLNPVKAWGEPVIDDIFHPSGLSRRSSNGPKYVQGTNG